MPENERPRRQNGDAEDGVDTFTEEQLEEERAADAVLRQAAIEARRRRTVTFSEYNAVRQDVSKRAKIAPDDIVKDPFEPLTHALREYDVALRRLRIASRTIEQYAEVYGLGLE